VNQQTFSEETYMTLSLDDQRRLADLTVSEVARRSGVKLTRTWRALRIGSTGELKPTEAARIERVISNALEAREKQTV